MKKSEAGLAEIFALQTEMISSPPAPRPIAR